MGGGYFPPAGGGAEGLTHSGNRVRFLLSLLKGLVSIANDDKRIDWNAIRAEYIAGGISQRKIAAKYGIPYNSVIKKANAEKWFTLREQAKIKGVKKAQQKTADAAADNAVIAQRIKRKLLMRLEREVDDLPDEGIGTESWSEDSDGVKGVGITKTKGIRYKLRDLTAAYKDLTEDLPKPEENKNAPIMDLLRKLDDECGI